MYSVKPIDRKPTIKSADSVLKKTKINDLQTVLSAKNLRSLRIVHFATNAVKMSVKRPQNVQTAKKSKNLKSINCAASAILNPLIKSQRMIKFDQG